MRVAIFVSYQPPHIGGVEVVAESQIKSLSASGHHVSAITSACGAKPGLVSYDNYSVRRVRAWNFLESRLGAPCPILAPTGILHGYRAAKKADVIHAHDAFYPASLMAVLCAKILDKPLVLTQHIGMIPHRSRFVNYGQALVFGTTGRIILRRSQRVIVVNSRVAKFLVDSGVDESDITFLANGVDTGAFSPVTAEQKLVLRRKYNLPSDKLLALFVGRFVHKKGITKLLGLGHLTDVDMVFVGGNAPAGHGRDDHHFLGQIGREAMPEIYQLCDMFVLPSEGEGFPVTVQEAMACGLPIVVGEDEAYEPYKLDRSLMKLVRPEADELSKALREVAASPSLREDMARYSRQYALENFSWSHHINELMKVYDTAISRHSMRRKLASGTSIASDLSEVVDESGADTVAAQ